MGRFLLAYCIGTLFGIIAINIPLPCYAQQKLEFKGHLFDMVPAGVDSHKIIDPITNERKVASFKLIKPVSLDGKQILDMSALPAAEKAKINKALETYIVDNLKHNTDLTSLDDGKIELLLNDFVIDEKGKLVFYYLQHLEYIGPDRMPRLLPGDAKIDTILAQFQAVHPVLVNGQPAIVCTDLSFWHWVFYIKDHQLFYEKH